MTSFENFLETAEKEKLTGFIVSGDFMGEEYEIQKCVLGVLSPIKNKFKGYSKVILYKKVKWFADELGIHRKVNFIAYQNLDEIVYVEHFTPTTHP